MAKRTRRLRRRELRAIREFGASRRRRKKQQLDPQALAALHALRFDEQFAGEVKTGNPWRTLRALLWRYRHQLAPIVAILATWVLGIVVHAQRHGLRMVLGVGAVVIVGAWLFSRWWLDRAVERAYAVVVLTATAVWLAFAAAHGASRPMPAILWVGGFALAAPWWYHYRIRWTPSQQAEDRLQTWAERVARKTLPGSTLADVTEIEQGWTATIELPPGEAEAEHAIKATALITSAYRLPVGSVSVEADPMDGSLAKLLVVVRNPLHRVLPWPGPSLDPETGQATIGLYADGQPVPWRFFRYGSGSVHGMISGATDAGKSTLLDQLAAQAAWSRLAVVWVIDPKLGQSMPNWIDHADWYALGIEEGKLLLRVATRIGSARMRHLAGLRWVDDQGRERRGKSFFDPTPDMPEIRIFIDEAQDVLADPDCCRMVEWLTKKGRSVGFGVILGTQVPSIDQLGGSLVIRSQVTSGNVIVFRTGSGDRLSGRMVVDLPVEPWKLPKELPDGRTAAGIGYTTARTVAMRSYLPDDGYHWASTAPRTELDLLSIAAGGREYGSRHDRREAILTGDTDEEPPLPDPAPAEPTTRNALQAVIAALPADGADIDRGQLIKHSGYSIRAVTDALRELVDTGHVVRTGHGRYRLAYPAADA